MSADTSKYSHIKDEDVLRKMWQDTDDFGKKKEIRSHMYKLREQRLREFYNGSEITESRKTTTSGKVTHDSTHADSLVDQSFQSLKSKEVRDSESPTRDIHYKSPDKMASKEWQVETNNETSLDGKTKIHSSVAALHGTQKIDGGQIDFKAKTEKMASVYRDANENSSTTRSQSSSSSHMVTSSNTQHELPSNIQGVTKVIRETKTLPDGSTVTTTRYDTTSGTSHIASQSSTSNRQVNDNRMIELPGGVQEVTKVIKETKTFPYGSTETSTRYNTTTNRVINEQESNINIQNQRDLSNNLQAITKITKETKISPVNSTTTKTKYDSVDDNKHTTIDDGKTIQTSSSSRITSTKAAPEFPSDLQGVTKVTKETKTLPDGSIMTITKYDTATGTSTHSEIIGNVKMSKDHSSITNKSTKHTEEAVTIDNRQNYKKQDHSSITNKSIKHSEEAVTIDNRQNYKKQEDRFVDTVKNDQHYNIDNKITVVSTTERNNNKDDRRIKESVNVTKHTVDETDGNKISPSKIASTKITTNDVTKQQNTNSFINTERQQEEVTRDTNIREVVSPKVDQKPREKESPKPEYQPSKPTTGQYETTYKTDYTNRKISVDVSPTHDAFARSLRSVSPDRIPSRGNHRTSNSSIPEKMRHPSRISPDRQPKDRSISPTKSDTFKKTVSQETITISTSKQNITNKTTKKDVITSDQYLSRSRSPSPKKLYKNEIVTDLDEDLNVTTVKPGSRPTSLELTKKPKKITDRSPSSPLTDLGSPKRSPVKEIRRSSSFRSPTKELSSPTKPSKGSSAKSPTKEVSTKILPGDKPLKRTDTYEERCRQILGITEVTEKRKNSLERSSSKRNSLRRNISSQFVDTTEIVTSPTKSPVKERPASPTKSPVKERPASPTKSSVKERPKSPVKQRPASPTKTPSKQKPSTDLDDVEITKTTVTKEIIYKQKENDITEKQPLDITTETPRKTSPVKEQSSTITTVRNETVISTTTKDETAITDDNTTISRSKPTREPVEGKPKETSKSPIKDTQKFVRENDTSIINNSDMINIEESVTIDDINRKTITKGPHPNDKVSSQPNIPSKQVPNNTTDSSSSTTKFILQEKLITDIHSSTEAIVDDNEVINITKTEFNKIPVSKKTPELIGHPKTIIKTTDKSSKTTEYTSPFKKENVKTITKDTLDEVDNINVITQKSSTVTDTVIRNEKIQRVREEEKPATKVSRDTKPKEPIDEKYPVPTKTSSPSKPSKINKTEEKTDKETIIDEFVVEKYSDTPKIILGHPISEDIKPIKKNKDTSTKGVKTNTITKEDDTVVVTDEFEIVSNPNEKPTNKKPGLTEYPSQIKKPITKKVSQDKIIPSKSKPIKEKPQLSEFPSQIKKDKKPASREPIATEKFFEPISYENKVPVEEPLMIKKNITPCIEDEVTKSIVKKTETVSKKPVQKEIPVINQKVTTVKKTQKLSDKNIENPISRKPINGISEYKDQYSRTKPTSVQKSPSNKIYSTTEVTTKTVFKPSDKINSVPTRPTAKTLVNGVHKPKESSSLILNSVKVTKTTDAVTKKTNRVITSKENEKPGQKFKKEPVEKLVIKKVSPVTKIKPSEQLTTKKHIVTTTITLKDNRQPKLITKTTKTERNRVTDLKQKHVNEYVSTDTDEDEKIVETRETVDVTRRTINKKPEKKCITTKTVIINNNVGEKRQVIVDLQRSKSSREPTPDRICPVPTNNGGYESPRYPDEIVEPDDDEIRRKPKRLSDIPLIESENVSNFSRITEITDSKCVTAVDKVEETDESLLSVNKKINLFLDNVDKVKQVKKKPAPKVERPKLEIDAGLESDECLLSVSEKVTKFVNAADQFMNVHDVGERPKSPRCKFYNDKNTSETFITTEQKVSETQTTKVDTGKISLDNLNKIDTKSEDVKTTSETGKKENRAPSPNKFKPTDKPEQKYPNYSTITKKVSLENLDIKNSLKSSEDVPENPGSKKRFSTEYITTTTTTETRETRSGSRDISPEDTRYNNRTSPNRKSPDLSNKSVTPTRRPSNDYGSTKTRKTEDISTSRDSSPDDGAATPKTSKTKIVEDKKTILSSTGRLRSTESIKKARAIFENIAKDQEPTNPANKSPTTKNKISKKLNYIDDKKNSPNLTETHPKSDETPHYMLPLDRSVDTHSQVTDITTTISNTDSRTIKTESNVSARYSRPSSRSPIRNTTRPESPDTRSESSDVPHYMLPLDRSVHTNSHEIRESRPRSKSPRDNSPRARSPEDRTKSAEVPHYMLPLDHSVHSHSHVKNTTVRESRSKVQSTGRDSPRYRSPEVRSESGEVPHYRLPLDRSEHTHSQYTTSTISKNRPTTESPKDDTPRNRSPENRSQTGEVPHYRLPLDRSEHTHSQYTTSTIRKNRPRTESPEDDTPRNRSPEDRSQTGEVPHYRLPLDRSEHTHSQYTTSTIRKSRPRADSPEDNNPRDRTPEVRSETDEVPHYRLPLDRSVHDQSQYTTSTVRESRLSRTKYPEDDSPRNRSPVTRCETDDVPHYRLPLDRSIHTHSQYTTSTTRKSGPRAESPEDYTPRNRSPEVRSEGGDVPHYRLPLDRSVHTHSHYTTSATRESRHRDKSPEDDSPRNKSPMTRSEAGDVRHYRLPLDRSVHTHHYTTSTTKKSGPRTESPEDYTPRNRSPEVRSEAGDVPHYRLPLDRNVHTHSHVTTSAVRDSRPRTKSPGRTSPRNRSPELRSETGDVPHYRLPSDRSVHHHSTTSAARDSRPRSKSPGRDSPISRTPEGRDRTGDVPHYMLPLDKSTPSHGPHGVISKANVETRTTKFGITLKKVQPGSIVSTPSKPTPNKPSSERKFSNIESITEKDIEDIFEIEILEELLQKIESYELRRVIRTQIRLVKKLISENTLTIYIKEKKLISKQNNSSSSRKSSYTRKTSDQSITTKTHSIQENSVKTDTLSKRPTSQDTSPQRTVKMTKKPEEDRKPSPERTGTRNIITTTTTTTSRYSPTHQQSPNVTDSSYKTQSRTNYTITGTSEPTEIIRKSSPERGTKTKVTETSIRTEQTRKLSTDKTSTTTVTKQATGASVLKKTEIRQKKTEDDKPEWVKQRNLKKVSSTSTTEKKSTSLRKAVKEEKRITSAACEPTDLITSSYGVGPTDENGSPLFGLKALRTQSNGTTKVQGTFVKSEYYSENGNEPVGQISVTKYSTDPRDLSTEDQIQNNDLVTSVTTTQQFGYDNTPSLEALTCKKGKQIEDSVTEVTRTSNFKRQNSVKALSQKFIDTAVESLKNERQTTYPKAGLILRTSSFKDSKNASSDEDISTDVMTATKTSKQTTTTTTTSGGTFLSNKSTVTGVADVISRMKTEEYQEGDSSEDIEAKSLLNKFIGSQVILSGMENRSLTTSKTSTSDIVPITSSARKTIKITTTATEGGKTKTKTLVFQSPITEEELENIWDEQTLRLLLEQSTQYEERRVIRNRLRSVMAEQEACADLVEKASQDQPEGKIEENVSVEKTTTQSPTATTTTVTKVTTQQQITKKPLSPFAKFRQLDKQNSVNTPPGTPGTPKSPGNGPLFKFTDPAVSLSAATIKERLLFWCKMKTKEYENVQLDNFSTSWADGLAFCALIHHFLPDAFDYHALTPKERRHNFELAFRVASEKADIFPLLDVDDMMATRRPDWKCVFTYVQSVYRRFKDEEI